MLPCTILRSTCNALGPSAASVLRPQPREQTQQQQRCRPATKCYKLFVLYSTKYQICLIKFAHMLNSMLHMQCSRPISSFSAASSATRANPAAAALQALNPNHSSVAEQPVYNLEAETQEGICTVRGVFQMFALLCFVADLSSSGNWSMRLQLLQLAVAEERV